jgi:hypothetical protein
MAKPVHTVGTLGGGATPSLSKMSNTSLVVSNILNAPPWFIKKSSSVTRFVVLEAKEITFQGESPLYGVVFIKNE